MVANILHQYGKVVIAIFVALLVIGIVFGKWFTVPGRTEKGTMLESIGAQSMEAEEKIDDATIDDTAVSKTKELYDTKTAPSLTTKKTAFSKGVTYSLNDIVTTDSGCKLTISDITFSDESVSNAYVLNDTNITFNKRGAYRMRITSTSPTTGLKTSRIIELTVQKKF